MCIRDSVCAARLLGKRGVLAVAGADLGAAAATVFFTAVVNHALHAERFDLLPWASLGLADNPLVYDRGRHDGKQGLWATTLSRSRVPRGAAGGAFAGAPRRRRRPRDAPPAQASRCAARSTTARSPTRAIRSGATSSARRCGRPCSARS